VRESGTVSVRETGREIEKESARAGKGGRVCECERERAQECARERESEREKERETLCVCVRERLDATTYRGLRIRRVEPHPISRSAATPRRQQ